MTIQEQLIEALRGLPPLDQQKVLDFAQHLHYPAPASDTLYARARRIGAVGVITDAPPDLSTNKRYLADLGRD
jgi:hypothetical protein